MRRFAILLALVTAGCLSQYKGSSTAWYIEQDGVAPRGNTVSVCHAFGCHLKTSYSFSNADIRQMRRMLRGARTAKAERAAIRKMIGWAERRVAPKVGSANDVGGLDLHNAGKAGQMDCIDEASNTMSYLLVAANNGLLRHHTVARPVSRGYFLDGRYPHATAVVVDKAGTPWAVDSWPDANGVPPKVMPLDQWFDESPAR
ncbi:MAG: hypothetical protein AAGF49_07810 [Pseudomonadota bacterium]